MTTKDRNYYTMIVQDKPLHLLAVFNMIPECLINNAQPMWNMVMILILKWIVKWALQIRTSFRHFKWAQIIVELRWIPSLCPSFARSRWSMTTWRTNIFILPIKHRKLSLKHIIRQLRTIVLNSVKHKKHAIISKRTKFWNKRMFKITIRRLMLMMLFLTQFPALKEKIQGSEWTTDCTSAPATMT